MLLPSSVNGCAHESTACRWIWARTTTFRETLLGREVEETAVQFALILIVIKLIAVIRTWLWRHWPGWNRSLLTTDADTVADIIFAVVSAAHGGVSVEAATLIDTGIHLARRVIVQLFTGSGDSLSIGNNLPRIQRVNRVDGRLREARLK
jgi:hypothetical protein